MLLPQVLVKFCLICSSLRSLNAFPSGSSRKLSTRGRIHWIDGHSHNPTSISRRHLLSSDASYLINNSTGCFNYLMKTNGCVSSSPLVNCGPKFAAKVPVQLFAASLWIANIEYNPEVSPTLDSSSRDYRTSKSDSELLDSTIAHNSSKSKTNEDSLKSHNSISSANVSRTVKTSRVISGYISSNLTDCDCEPKGTSLVDGTYANHSIPSLNNPSSTTVPGSKTNDITGFSRIPLDLLYPDKAVEKNRTSDHSSQSEKTDPESGLTRFPIEHPDGTVEKNKTLQDSSKSSLKESKNISSTRASNTKGTIKPQEFKSLDEGQNTRVTNGKNISESSNLESTFSDSLAKEVEPLVVKPVDTDTSTNTSESIKEISPDRVNNTFLVVYEEDDNDEHENSGQKTSNESASVTKKLSEETDKSSMHNSTKELLTALNMSDTGTLSKSPERPILLGMEKDGKIQPIESLNVSISLDDGPDYAEKEKEKPEQSQSPNFAVNGSNTDQNTQSPSINNTITSNSTSSNSTDHPSSSTGDKNDHDHESDEHKDLQTENASSNLTTSMNVTQGAAEASKGSNVNETQSSETENASSNSNASMNVTQGAAEAAKGSNVNETQSSENQGKVEESNQDSDSTKTPSKSENSTNHDSNPADSASDTPASTLSRRYISPSESPSDASNTPTPLQALNPEPYPELISPPIHSYSKGICGEYDGEADYAVCLWSGSDDTGSDASKSGWLSSAITGNCGKRIKVARPGSPWIIARLTDGCSFEVKDPSIACNQIFLSKQVFLSMKPTRKELITGTLEGGVIWDFVTSSDPQTAPV